MFAPIWKGYFPEEMHVGYVTNGVHFPTWSATEWKQLYVAHFDENYWFDQSNPEYLESHLRRVRRGNLEDTHADEEQAD